MNVNQSDRLVRMEVVLEMIPEIRNDIKAIRADLDADKAELAALKNKGTGILVGVAIAAGAFGATASTFWRWLVSLFA